MNKRRLLLLFTILLTTGLIAQESITNIVVTPKTDGSGFIDVYFDLDGAGSTYNISLETSFDGGSTYVAISAEYLDGDVADIAPGNDKHIIWDGVGSFPETFTNEAKLKIIAAESIGGNCPATVTDIDGNTYTTTLIGEQCWMAENLNTTKDAAGNVITRICYDNNTTNCGLYGGMYDWTTMMNGAASSTVNPSGVQGICPNGWHLPSDAEWTQLIGCLLDDYGIVNTNTVDGAGNALKSCRQVNSLLGGECSTTEHPRWEADVTHFGTNDFSFSAYPGGYRNNNGTFYYLGNLGLWWSTTQNSSSNVWSRYIANHNGAVDRYENEKLNRFSVRCIKDENTSIIPTVQTGAAINITHNSADIEGEIIEMGGTEIIQHGHCWAITPNASTDDFKTELGAIGVVGIFTSNLSGLDPETSYYVRAYATNSEGTAYSEEITFITLAGGGDGQPCPGAPTVTDIDGNTYNTVQIGEQCWMAENLNTTKDASGNSITRYCYDNNTTNCGLYGGLYDWVTVMNGAASSSTNPSGVQGICPNGWHLPSDSEWTELVDYLVSRDYPNDQNDPNGAGNALKSCRQVNSPLGGDCNTTAHPRWNWHGTHYGTNVFGFSALPGGYRLWDGWFTEVGNMGLWRSATLYSSSSAWSRGMYRDDGWVFRGHGGKSNGYSVRCIRD